ncbi:MAG TPA: CHAT domain-containing protein, partial [Nonomuraea sp.]|nr:CHAT domain-containing protein [Nonomuraea sp.]
TPDQNIRDLRNAVQFSSQQATVAAVLSALDGAGLAHLSAHLVGGAGNPWFSAAELADGMLVPSTIRLLSRPPCVVVIDRCEPVDAFGFAGALIDAGVRTVVTPVSKVGDEACAATLADFYRNLASGDTIAQALAYAIAKDPQRRPFICLGADGTVDLS